ncbi:citrate synthase [Salibacterium aidingense]|uniref:citrate synthase n=1 Tax=Salibacterium aidingense TaxID=384933 RepID=UPI003BDC0573
MSTIPDYKPGLEGVIASETKVSLLDVEQEEIVIRGYNLIELAEKVSYLEVAGLLLNGELPGRQQQQEMQQEISHYLELPDYLTSVFPLFPSSMGMMDRLRTGVSMLAGEAFDLDDRSKTANKRKTMHLLGALPSIVAGSYRSRAKQEILRPLSRLSFSANFLYMMTGSEPSQREADTFDQSLSLYSEHELPNSTFAARVIASTNSDIYGAMTGAVASLKGPLHGGANEEVMKMLLQAQTPEGLKELLDARLAAKERIMGFGHRVYMKKMDPRATLMKKSLYDLAQDKNRMDLYEICDLGETIMAQKKGLYPNLDYYAAPVYYLLGIPIELYTPVFFAARAAGIGAHIIEQQENNRLFRPRVRYTGPRGLHP